MLKLVVDTNTAFIKTVYIFVKFDLMYSGFEILFVTHALGLLWPEALLGLPWTHPVASFWGLRGPP